MSVRRIEFGRHEEGDVGRAGQFPQHIVGGQVPGDDQGREEQEDEGADISKALFPRLDTTVSMFRTEQDESEGKKVSQSRETRKWHVM